jgi:DNA-binding CsgD family transcriptional regulator
MGRFCELELLEPDVLSFADLLADGRIVGVLSIETDERPERSARYRALYRPHGMRDELRVAFLAAGRCYGAACLLRAQGSADFTEEEARLVAGLAADVADGLRVALAASRVRAVGGPGTGVLVADDAGRVLSATDHAAAWLEELGGCGPDAPLPAVVHGVLSCARRRAAGFAGTPAWARVATPSGTWLTVSASGLSGDERTWGILLEPSRPAEVLQLIAEAHDLTPREREVLGMLMRGAPDKVVAARLGVSPHTAREHAGRILRKFGARTRGELQAALFGAHYEPWLATARPSTGRAEAAGPRSYS